MTIYPGRDPERMMVCSACAKTVSRADCHKNRFGEYLCSQCTDTGLRATNKQKGRYYLKRMAHWSMVGLAITLPVLLVIGIFFAIF